MTFVIGPNNLKEMLPQLTQSRLERYAPHLFAAMEEFGITSPKRIAAFLAQLGHESADLRYMEEIADGSAYEGRRDLGNIYEGDGKKYKGRGPIQLTGRYNYREAGEALGADFEGSPELAAEPDYGFRIAGWYWAKHNLNALADVLNFDQITQRINGGYRGKADRDDRFIRCLRVMVAV